jgi:hypothetical protein
MDCKGERLKNIMIEGIAIYTGYRVRNGRKADHQTRIAYSNDSKAVPDFFIPHGRWPTDTLYLRWVP